MTRPIDHYRARLIIARLDEAGDTPAARLIEQLLREREIRHAQAPTPRPDTRIGPGVQRASSPHPTEGDEG